MDSKGIAAALGKLPADMAEHVGSLVGVEPDRKLVIHKYRLPFMEAGLSVVDVPVQVGDHLHLAMQHGEVHVWAAVDPHSREILARFHLVGTGGAVDPSWYHLGTVMDNGFVWHVFSSTDTAITRQSGS